MSSPPAVHEFLQSFSIHNLLPALCQRVWRGFGGDFEWYEFAMDLLAYFGRELRGWEAEPSAGEALVERIRQAARVRSAEEAASAFAGPKREQYASVDDYDPVLRWHCRLDEPGGP